MQGGARCFRYLILAAQLTYNFNHKLHKQTTATLHRPTFSDAPPRLPEHVDGCLERATIQIIAVLRFAVMPAHSAGFPPRLHAAAAKHSENRGFSHTKCERSPTLADRILFNAGLPTENSEHRTSAYCEHWKRKVGWMRRACIGRWKWRPDEGGTRGLPASPHMRASSFGLGSVR